MAKNRPSKGSGSAGESLVFDQKDRIDFVKGFAKRKQERKEQAKQKAQEKDREIRRLLRQKRREALKKIRQENEDKRFTPSTSEQPIENEYENFDDDEEDDNEIEEVAHLKQADYQQILEAQKPATIDQYDGIQITPFNLVEECEEGEFDKAGNFIYKKVQPDEEHDTWAESIDWKAVEEKEKERGQQGQSSSKQTNSDNVEKMNDDEPTMDRLTCFKSMLTIIKPKETVQRAIKRLGDSVPRRRLTQNRNRRDSTVAMDTSDASEIVESKRKLESLIEMAHHLLEEGDTDIYQKSYEQLQAAVNER